MAAGSVESNVTFVEISEEEKEVVNKYYGDYSIHKDILRTEPRIVTLTRCFKTNITRVMNIKVRPTDVWLITPPKCGTTWVQEITWLVMNDADVEGISINLFERTPFIDMPMILNLNEEEMDKYFKDLEARPSPRLIKSHLPFELLPPDLVNVCKVIFCARNVKDAAVSFFHHERLMKHHDLVVDNFEGYARDIYKPALQALGGYFEMLESGWKRKNNPNFLFLWYEELKKDQKKAIIEIMKHIDMELDDEQVSKIDESMQFENYKKSSTVNKPNPHFYEGRGQFVRKGIVGDHINYFSKELKDEWDEWIKVRLDKIGISDKKIISYFNID